MSAPHWGTLVQFQHPPHIVEYVQQGFNRGKMFKKGGSKNNLKRPVGKIHGLGGGRKKGNVGT